jgi:membrane protein implicated in regulation of membrane protease activity
MNWEAIFWLAAMVVFIAAEAMTVSLVSIWFAAGALGAIIVALLGGGLVLQVTVFLALAVALLLSLRSIVRKHFTPHVTKTNVDAIVGSVGYVTAAIDNVSATGQVKLGAMEWTARSTSGNPITAGTLVKVDRIEGVKAYVSIVNANVNV